MQQGQQSNPGREKCVSGMCQTLKMATGTRAKYLLTQKGEETRFGAFQWSWNGSHLKLFQLWLFWWWIHESSPSFLTLCSIGRSIYGHSIVKQTARNDAVLAHDGVFVLCGVQYRDTTMTTPMATLLRCVYINVDFRRSKHRKKCMERNAVHHSLAELFR